MLRKLSAARSLRWRDRVSRARGSYELRQPTFIRSLLVTASSLEPGPHLVGRTSELGLTDELLAGVARPRRGSLVLRGEVGIVKTVLLHAARAAATRRGWSVLSTEGVESASALAYAGLHRLVRPLLELAIEGMPPTQATSLRARRLGTVRWTLDDALARNSADHGLPVRLVS